MGDDGLFWRTADGVERWVPRGWIPGWLDGEGPVDLTSCVRSGRGAVIADPWPLAPEVIGAQVAIEAERIAAFNRWIYCATDDDRDELRRCYEVADAMSTIHRAAHPGYVLRPLRQGPTRAPFASPEVVQRHHELWDQVLAWCSDATVTTEECAVRVEALAPEIRQVAAQMAEKIACVRRLRPYRRPTEDPDEDHSPSDQSPGSR